MFWSDPSHLSHVDDELYKFCFANATQYVLANGPNDESMANNFAGMGIIFKEMTERGVAAFVKHFKMERVREKSLKQVIRFALMLDC